MKTLVLHPEDPTTDFLKAIYTGLGYTVINKELPLANLKKALKTHNRVILLGHGLSWGLIGWDEIAFGSKLVPYVNQNLNNIFIWCNADIFVIDHSLQGFYSGMFISELKEAKAYGISTTQEDLNYSNDLFSSSVRTEIINPTGKGLSGVKSKYVSDSCPVIKFNNDRLYHSKSIRPASVESTDNSFQL